MKLVPQELLELSQAILDSLGVGLVGAAVDGAATAPAGAFTGLVQISGDWAGTVSVQCSEGLARRVASAMFGREASELDAAEVIDAVGELANMVGGNLKGTLPAKCQLSLPRVALPGSSSAAKPAGPALVSLGFPADQLLIEVRPGAVGGGA